MSKVSVVVPVYGVEQYIERCARSLFEQTLDSIEFIFIDDCTLDNSMGILNRVVEEYRPRFAGMKWTVRTEKMPTNSGLPAVRRHGLQLAKGDYIVHCDSDDWVDKDMYRLMYEKAQTEDADMVVCDYYSTDGIKHKCQIGCHTNTIGSFFEGLLYQKEPWVLWNKMFHRSTYAEDIIYPKYAMGEDCVFCLQLVWNSRKMAYVDTPLYYYYNNSQSITRDNSDENILKKYRQSIANANDILLFAEHNDLLDKYSEAIDSIMFNKKNILLPLINKKKYYQLWKETFSELNYRILLNTQVSLRKKINHILALSHLYRC